MDDFYVPWDGEKYVKRLEDRIKELEAAEKQAAEHVLAMAEAVASVEAENQQTRDELSRLKAVAEAAERYLTKNDYDGLFQALRAAGYLGGG